MYILINGTETENYGLRTTKLPPLQIAQKRIELLMVPGRSGYLTRWDGSYEDAVKTARFFYRGNNPVEIAKFILSGNEIVFSNEPDKKYSYRIDITTDLINTIATWHQFEVQFICNPIKREKDPMMVVTDAPVVLASPCNHPAQPTITVYGAGAVTLQVGEQTVGLSDIAPAITVDGDMMECYQGAVSANNKMMGEFPVIEPGEAVEINWTGAVDRVEISPNWRWV